MRIAIDAMGGDNAPGEIISGVLESIELLGDNDEMIIVGPQDIIEPQLPSEKSRKGVISIVDAPQVIDMDEPPVLLGNNEGRNPVEYLLVALSGCITTSIVAHASAKGIEIKGVESRYEGDIDLRGFLGLSEEVPVGYQEIRVFFKIDADVSEEQREEMVRMGQKYSPVYNTISKSAPVSVHLDK